LAKTIKKNQGSNHRQEYQKFYDPEDELVLCAQSTASTINKLEKIQTNIRIYESQLHETRQNFRDEAGTLTKPIMATITTQESK
jgi:hypothetical protein